MTRLNERFSAVGGAVLAMAGRRGPRGGGDEGADKGSEEISADGGALPDDKPDDKPVDGGSNTGDGSAGPRNPWLSPEESAPRRSGALEDLFRSGRGNFSGQGKNQGQGNGRPTGLGDWLRLPPRAGGKNWLPLMLAGVGCVWLFTTSAHELGTTEQGIVTIFGKYSRTIGPGVSFTLPWPVESVSVADVTSIRRESIPEGEAQKLMLTSDQSLVDLSYLVRWNIRDLKLYTFQLDDPNAAVRDLAESAMRTSVSDVKLNDVMGGIGRAQIEDNVRKKMQETLDAYHSGVLIEGVDIKKADPPSQVNDAFQQVSAAQQEASRDVSKAQGYAQQVVAGAQGEATAFDKVYAQYKLAPEVTRRRMYYETMERVLSHNDKIIVEGNSTSYLPLPQLRNTPHQDADISGGHGQ